MPLNTAFVQCLPILGLVQRLRNSEECCGDRPLKGRKKSPTVAMTMEDRSNAMSGQLALRRSRAWGWRAWGKLRSVLKGDACAKPANTCGGDRGRAKRRTAAPPPHSRTTESTKSRRRSRAEEGRETGDNRRTEPCKAAAHKPGDRERAASRGDEENLKHGLT